MIEIFPDDYEVIDTEITPISPNDFSWGNLHTRPTDTGVRYWWECTKGDTTIYCLIAREMGDDGEFHSKYTYYHKT